MTSIDPRAGRPPTADMLIDVAALTGAYFTRAPDPSQPEQRVSFGTSGHRGTALDGSFNEAHVLAISQAICEYRRQQSIDGPLFIGCDTHALSRPAFESAVEVFAANGVDIQVSNNDEYTPTPAVSHAILCHNHGRDSGLADGVVITPSHNPPADGGFKYNPPNGGPADKDITAAIEARANALLADDLSGVERMPFDRARRAATTHRHDFLTAYVEDLQNVIDFDAIRASGIRLGVDPLGGAGVHYWPRIAERYAIDLTVTNRDVDPTFRFLALDWDGRIRMDPSSPYAMAGLIALKDEFDIAFACDTDHDRHGIVTRSEGLMQPNHYLAVAIDYLFRRRPRWPAGAAVGKTAVSSGMIDRVARRLGRNLHEVPVGFKWFVEGLLDGTLGFGGEESAGASFLRQDGSAWTTDKDGIVPSLLAAEITARSGRDPAAAYAGLVREFGEPFYRRVDAPATASQKEKLARLTPGDLHVETLAGEPVIAVLSHAPGNGAALGGVKVVAENGWFATRPSGTEAIYKIYAESFRGEDQLDRILQQAESVVTAAIG